MVEGYVDTVVLALMPEVGLGLAKAVGGPLIDGFPAERYIEKMDEAGVEISILLASKGGSHEIPGKERIDRYPHWWNRPPDDESYYPKTDWANPVTGLRPLPRWDVALVRWTNDGWGAEGYRGEDRVLLGSDFPEWEYSVMIEEVREILTPSAFTKVCRDNAVRVFRLR